MTFANSIVNIDAEEPDELARYGMPLIIRVFPQLLSTQIVGVQPIQGSGGLNNALKKIFLKEETL